MPIENRPEVVDYVAWGNLIKRWAKGLQPVPVSIADLKAQCNIANVGLTLPDFITDLHVVQKPKNVFVLRLPPGDMLTESEEALKNGGLYPIPDFYNVRYDKVLDIVKAEMLNFHAQRVGDYVIRLCA